MGSFLLVMFKTWWPKILKLIKGFMAKKKAEPTEIPYKHLITSTTATKYNINNTPNKEQIANLQALNVQMFIPIRVALEGTPAKAILNSGFRSKALNKKVKGSKHSDHCKGLALDLACYGQSNEWLFNFIHRLGLNYKQLILEPGWVHIALDTNSPPRKQRLEAYREGGRMKYRSI